MFKIWFSYCMHARRLPLHTRDNWALQDITFPSVGDADDRYIVLDARNQTGENVLRVLKLGYKRISRDSVRRRDAYFVTISISRRRFPCGSERGSRNVSRGEVEIGRRLRHYNNTDRDITAPWLIYSNLNWFHLIPSMTTTLEIVYHRRLYQACDTHFNSEIVVETIVTQWNL